MRMIGQNWCFSAFQAFRIREFAAVILKALPMDPDIPAEEPGSVKYVLNVATKQR